MPFRLQAEKSGPVEPIRKLGSDVVGWHEERGGELVGLALSNLVANFSSEAVQDQVAKFVGCIEAGTVTQALVGPKGNNGPVGEVDAKCINFFDTDTEADNNDSVHFQQSHDILNWPAWDVPVVTDLGSRLFDIDGLKRLPFVDWDAREIEVGQRDVFFELKCEFPREVHVGERLLAISGGGGSKAAEEPVYLILSRGASWRGEERWRYPQGDRKPAKRRCGGLGVSVLELTDRSCGDGADFPGQLHLGESTEFARHSQPGAIEQGRDVAGVQLRVVHVARLRASQRPPIRGRSRS